MNDKLRSLTVGQLPLTSQLTYEEFRPMSASVTAEFAARSNRGLRPINDDHYLVLRLGRDQEVLASSLPEGEMPARFHEFGYGLVVADGMGAAGSGETASRLAIATLAHLLLHFGRWNLRVDPLTAQEIMARAERFYRRVDETVTEAGLEARELTGMGTTLTAAYSAGDELFVVHVGHSRAYLLRGDVLTQLTRDQTLAQRLNDTGRATPLELAAHDLRHILTDAVGGLAGYARIQIEHFRLKDRDRVLVCTNGLTDVVTNDQITKVIQESSSVDSQCQTLVDLALESGGTDNVTAVIARYTIPETASPVDMHGL
jgi:PPM family protein phosphatase